MTALDRTSNVSCSKSTITVNHKNQKICLDPRKDMDCDYIFVSHAHTDHLHRTKKRTKSNAKIITSTATSRIANGRGYELSNVCQDHGFELLDSGHILGSTGLLIEDDLYYTGDLSIRKRAFMKPAVIPKAKTLIIESTFGHEDYVFPRSESVIHEANILISEMYSQGRPIVLLGYPLGKAQILTQLFAQWEPIFVEDSIYKMNLLYSELGIDITCHTPFSVAENKGSLSSNKPWILIAPLNSTRNGFLDYVKRKYEPTTVGFSGWGIKPNFKYLLGLDHCFPFSDHCDYNDLISFVKRCGPEKVYTFHGFIDEFAHTLRCLGFDATSLKSKQELEGYATESMVLTDYFDKKSQDN